MFGGEDIGNQKASFGVNVCGLKNADGDEFGKEPDCGMKLTMQKDAFEDFGHGVRGWSNIGGQ